MRSMVFVILVLLLVLGMIFAAERQCGQLTVSAQAKGKTAKAVQGSEKPGTEEMVQLNETAASDLVGDEMAADQEGVTKAVKYDQNTRLPNKVESDKYYF